MTISLSKIIPAIILLGIAFHSKGAIKERVQSAVNGKKAVASMSRIVRIIQLHTSGIEGIKINDAGKFIRKYVATRSKGDASLDPWGIPYKIFIKQNKIQIFSAGSDGKFHTEDDLSHSGLLAVY